MITLRLFLLSITWTTTYTFSFKAQLSCYDQTSGAATACFPGDQEVAKNVDIQASSTCDTQFLRYTTTETGKVSTSSEDCTVSSDVPLHPVTSAVDKDDLTFWVSGSADGKNAVTNRYTSTVDMEVNVTIDLGVMTEIGKISLTFQSPRPHSMVILGRNSSDEDWAPMQYYSASCYSVFNRDPWFGGYSFNPDSVHCDQRQSDRSPMSGGKVVFEPSRRTQIARFLKFALMKLHSVSGGASNDYDIGNVYYYAISDISVLGRCFCNGHASFCEMQNPLNRTCNCQHNTEGTNCERCAKNYYSEPWRSFTRENSKKWVTCTVCDCNGNSADCEFDHRVWELNGGKNGGVCVNCRNNSLGQNCELCKPGFFRGSQGQCESCGCNSLGSLQTDCSFNRMCLCKAGVTGEFCDECLPEYYGFGNEEGCLKCECNPEGTRGGVNSCDYSTGQCPCKENVKGQTCSECIPGHFDLRADDEFGCKACFCSNHTFDCIPSTDPYRVTKMLSDFSGIGRQYGFDIAGWKATDLTGSECNLILEGSASERHMSLDSSPSKNGGNCKIGPNYSPIYFQLPEQFAGNRIMSYGLQLSFELKPVGDIQESFFTSRDLIIEGKIGRELKWITAGLNWHNNPAPKAHQWNSYSFRLDEKAGWDTSTTSINFQSTLLGVQRILIRGSYGAVACDIKNVALEIAEKSVSADFSSGRAFTAEKCFCPKGYLGSSCETCAPGFYRLDPTLGSLSACVPCGCNKHGTDCEESTGDCKCNHNTQGRDCSECADGYYGNPSKDESPNACQICPCGFTIDSNTSLSRPGKCKENLNGAIQCLECPDGYTGDRCQDCSKNFFRRNGKCVECNCNGNGAEINGNICNQLTGECLSCLNNTEGRQCEGCLDDHYGSALSDPSTCTRCQCSKEGTLRSYSPPLQSCSPSTGACICKDFVVGLACDACAEGYYGFDSGKGCFPCECSSVGSSSSVCDATTGQCPCLPNVSGRKCDQCASGSYGFNSTFKSPNDGYFVTRSFAGCLDCGCDNQGVANRVVSEDSRSVQCDDSGSCSPCRANVTGTKCDRCIENHYKFFEVNEWETFFVCKRCDSCYDFVQVAVDKIRTLALTLERSIKQIQSTPINFTGENFQQRLTEIVALATSTLRKAQLLDESTDDVAQYVDEADVICNGIVSRLGDIAIILQRIDQSDFSNTNTFDKLFSHVQDAEDFIDRMNTDFVEVEILLAEVQKMANEISSNKSQLLEQVELLESIAGQHAVNDSAISNTTRHAQRYTSQSRRMLGLIQNFEMILINHTNTIKANLDKLDPSVGEQLQRTHDYVHSVYEMTLKAFNEVNQPVPEYNFAPILEETRLLNNSMVELDIQLRRVNESNVRLGVSSADIRSEIGALLATSRDLNRNLSIFLVELYEMESGLNATVNRVSQDYYSGLERLALLKGYQNNSDSRQSFDEQYVRIGGIREHIDEGKEKCAATSALVDSQYRRQAKAVSQNAQLNLDAITRKQETAEDVYNKLKTMADVIDSEKEEMKVVDETLRKLDSKCDQILPLTEAVQKQKEASEKAVAADRNAKRLNSKLQGTSQLLDSLQRAMDSTNFLGDDEKNRIADTAARLKRIFDSFDIDAMTAAADEIEDMVSQMDDFLLDYEKRYLQALDDVQNAEEIAAGVKVICQSMSTPIS